MSQQWVEKWRPETFDEVQGNNSAIKRIRDWALNWEPGDPALLIHGDQGTGKTTVAMIAAEVIGASMNEINASSVRGKDDIEEIASDASSIGIDGERQLIFLDEVDGWKGVDPSPMADVLRDPPNPVIMTANRKWEVSDSVKNLKNVEMIQFKLSKSSIRARVRDIAEKEGVELTDQQLEALAEQPDLRSAINALQNLAEGGQIEREWDFWEPNNFSAMRKLLSRDPSEASQLKPPDLVLWADENLSANYRGLEAALSYDTLARADRYLGYAWEDEDFSNWKYAAELAKRTSYLRLTETPQPNWIDLSFPNWFRSKNVVNENPGEHELYQSLKDVEGGSYRMSGSFVYFRHRILPILRHQPEEDRFMLILNHDLSEAAMEALDVSTKEYQSWVETEAPEKGEWVAPTEDAMEW